MYFAILIRFMIELENSKRQKYHEAGCYDDRTTSGINTAAKPSVLKVIGTDQCAVNGVAHKLPK